MGNNSSKSIDPPSPHVRQPTSAHDTKDKAIPARGPRRRESIQVLPSTRATAAPPSASLESVHGQPTAQGTTTGSRSTHSRGRSQTSVSAQSRPLEYTHNGHERHDQSGTHASTESDSQQASSDPQTRNVAGKPRSSPQSVQVPIPAPADHSINPNSNPNNSSPHSGSGQDANMSPTFYGGSSHLSRPPRLPLPIQEEVLAPGSPIISSADLSDDVSNAAIDRNPSMLSSTTVDEDEQGELGDEFKELARKDSPLVETVIQWREGGENVYVTGSFSRWTKKWRMHKSQEDEALFERMLPLPVGTHHLTFIVDGNMRRSERLPTAVDYTNYLVNYVEVSVRYLPNPDSEQSSKQTTPQPTPTVERNVTLDHQQVSTPNLPPTPELKPQPASATPSAGPSTIVSGTSSQKYPIAKRKEDHVYHSVIPRFLADLDEPEESSRFQRAGAVLGTQPTPPALPMFLNKSILNGATPMKDDASVLIMPNHTVLNHLATSSIKHNVLATSATTRYKRKYVTSIMYKPTNDHGD